MIDDIKSEDISSDFTFYTLFAGPLHVCAISALRTYRTYCYIGPTRYKFVKHLRAKDTHRNNVPRLRGEKHDISLKILHQAGFRKRTAGSDIGKAPRSSCCTMSLSKRQHDQHCSTILPWQCDKIVFYY